MGWVRDREAFRRLIGVSIALAGAFLVAGCFQPLYGDRSASGQPGLRDALSRVEVDQITAPEASDEARMAVQIRNDLLFNFTGGGPSYVPTHRLKIQITSSRSVISIDRNSAFPNLENYTLTTSYSLTEITTGKVVLTGRARVPVSYDPVGQQRFARITGLQDAERRAAKTVSDNITTRLASFFVAGS